MELTQLRTLIQVAELGSLSKAADRMRIAQPALSRQVRLLEEELGVRLFERHGRGMVITEAGQDALRHAYRVVAEIQEIKSAVSNKDGALSGQVSIGMPPTVSDVLATPIVSAFQDRHPQATLRIVSAYSGYILDWLHKGDVDVAILFDGRKAQSVKSEPLLEERLHLIGSGDAALSPDRPIDLAALKDERMLLPSLNHSLRNLVEDCLRGTGISLNISVETDSYSTLKNLVSAGYGMTILPLAPITADIRSGLLTHAPLINPVPKRRLMTAVPTDRPATRLSTFAYDVMRQAARDLIRSGDWPGKLVV